LTFLRAYVSKPSILILDEATSSIVFWRINSTCHRNHNPRKNSIVIAHRLATIINADKIVVMDKGLIVEQGTHQELLSKEMDITRACIIHNFQ
jgi:ABC-type multidrug transport system fused ATPase/permease subunit